MGKSHKHDRSFRIEIPRKRERNTLVLAQARGEMLKPQRMTDKAHRDERNPRSWEDEDWGEDYE
jgi:hypothetical protein